MNSREEQLHIAVSNYIKYKYPNIVFTSESSGIRVNIGTAKKMKKQRSRHKLPDMIILEPRGGYCGLIMELKKSKSEIFRKDGTFRSRPHIQEQRETLNLLREKGYFAAFVCGIDDAIETIDMYMHVYTREQGISNYNNINPIP